MGLGRGETLGRGVGLGRGEMLGRGVGLGAGEMVGRGVGLGRGEMLGRGVGLDLPPWRSIPPGDPELDRLTVAVSPPRDLLNEFPGSACRFEASVSVRPAAARHVVDRMCFIDFSLCIV